MVPPSLGNPFSTKTFFNWVTRIFKRKKKKRKENRRAGSGVGVGDSPREDGDRRLAA
jgi:hypothetical protein